MKRFFPSMHDRPEKWMPAALVAYWPLAFMVLPAILPLLATGLLEDNQVSAWIDIVYHAINAFVVVIMLRSYFVDSFLNVQLETRNFLITVGIALLMMLVLPLVLCLGLNIDVFSAYPIKEMNMLGTAGFMVESLPLFGTLCHTLLTPITVVGLFYAAGFAPLSCRKGWLGYLVLPLMILIPNMLDAWARGYMGFWLANFLLQLPIHWIACWSYQKTDTVWAPLVTLSAFNLLTSLLCLLCL